jgi:hypothetical protein
MLLAVQQPLAMVDPMGLPFGLAALGSIITLALLLYFGCQRLAERSLKRAYADLNIHTVAGPNDVVLVYHTYHGFLIWHVEAEYRVILPVDDARELLGRLLRFNLSWGLLAKGGILIAPLAIYNYAAQSRSITKQETEAAFAAIQPNMPAFAAAKKPHRSRSWFYLTFGWLCGLLGGLFAVSGTYFLATRQFEAGFGGLALALLLG